MTGIYGLINNNDLYKNLCLSQAKTVRHSNAVRAENGGFPDGLQTGGAGRTSAVQTKRMVGSALTDSSSSKNQSNASKIITASKVCAEGIRESRARAKDTSGQLKRLQYSFKKISSEIIRSKTSLAAKKAASSARREVLRLKRKKAGGLYDEDEIQAAIDHAKAMERIAKKKAAHLEQEEMVKITDEDGKVLTKEQGLAAEDEDKEKEERDILRELTDPEGTGRTPDDSEELTRAVQEQAYQVPERMSGSAGLPDGFSESMSELSEQMSELADEMNEVLDETLMLEEMTAAPRKMSENEFKVFETKHRTSEMKDIAEADRDYLKAVFDHQASGSAGINIVL